MSLYIKRNPPPDGNPNGIIYAPEGALFFKTGSFYRLKYPGSSTSSSWENVFFQLTTNNFVYKTSEDSELLKRAMTGSFFYVKSTSEVSNTGWKLISNKSPLFLLPTPTPSITPSTTPTPTPTPTT